MQTKVHHNSSYYFSSHSFVVFLDHLNTGGYPIIFDASWNTEVQPSDLEKIVLEQSGTILHEQYWDGTAKIVYETDDLLVHLNIASGAVYIHMAGFDRAKIDALTMHFRERIPKSVARDNTILVRFWSLGANGGVNRARRIDVAPWQDVEINYTRPVRNEIDRLMDFDPDGASGQLLLWHGEPGTGKTHALRALGWEWRDWCDLHYIGDPEVFFGAKASYMFDVLMDNQSTDRWRLLVLEDSGELLTADAKVRTGQALSRLLNVVDGLIGQGLKILVLITTNEEVKSLHSAVSRHGRCASNIEFSKLTRDEVSEWTAAKGIDDPVQSRTIAELFAAASGTKPCNTAPKHAVGFGS